ncbi:MAG: T9SS type A sorting domain-containing protein [Bacteroidia bacterium]|nr:T9SS type A sorting domain-containing protein [Bacteroidia bacterium]
MKKLLLILLSASMAFQVMAQIELSKTLPPIGSTLAILQAANTSLIRPASGINQTWDYSSISFTPQFTIEIKALSAVAKRYQDSCPSAKYVEQIEVPGAPSPDYLPMEFFEDKGNYMVRVGQKGSNLNLEKKNDTVFVFNLGFETAEIYSGARRSYSGSGTLKIGNETYTNVVLIKGKSVVNENQDTGYTFFQIAPYWTRIASVMFSNGQSIGISYWKPGQNSTYIKEQYQSLEFSVFPNPSQGSICIQSNSTNKQLQFSLTDLSGKLIHSGNLSAGPISLSGLEKGIYLLDVKSDKERGYKKIIVE